MPDAKKDPLAPGRGEPAIATLLVAACALIIVIAGAVVTIVNPDSLSFADYVQALAVIGIGGGALGIGRGILAGSREPGGFGAASNDGGVKPYPDAEQSAETPPDVADTTALHGRDAEGGTTLLTDPDPGPTGKRTGPAT